jgi:hypothetical protein
MKFVVKRNGQAVHEGEATAVELFEKADAGHLRQGR